MVRKQIYLSKRQEQLLKRLSRSRGISEAEIIRNAIDKALLGESEGSGRMNTQASSLDAFIQLARSDRGLTGDPIRWNRAELYQERENRWIHHVSEGDDDAASDD